ncbi:MAG: hypothetical protein RIS52_969 [Pseudomonadota bacterium]
MRSNRNCRPQKLRRCLSFGLGGLLAILKWPQSLLQTCFPILQARGLAPPPEH